MWFEWLKRKTNEKDYEDLANELRKTTMELQMYQHGSHCSSPYIIVSCRGDYDKKNVLVQIDLPEKAWYELENKRCFAELMKYVEEERMKKEEEIDSGRSKRY